MKIRIELGSLTAQSQSGVANYTRLLAEALDQHQEATVFGSYFNFLDRHITPRVSLKQPFEKNALIPLRVYTKLQSYNLAPAFDIFSQRVDLTIFPNFATWPTIHTKISATVVHDLTYLHFPEVVEHKNLAHLRRVVPRSIKKADFVITVSEAVKAEIIKEFNLPAERCVVSTIPPDEKYFLKNTNGIYVKYQIPTKKFIYFIGNLEPRKDLPTLIAAYRCLPETIKNEYSLVLAGGNGWKTKKSRQAIKQAQDAGEKVIHVGFVDNEDASAFYQNASLFVMPSIYEGFGMPILEAMASNCPVLASDIPVLREAGGDAALYAEKQNPQAFARIIQEILSNPQLAHDMTVRGASHLKNFSWKHNVETIISTAERYLK